MSVFQIKLMAISTMVIDHIGLFLFPNVIWMYFIGRLSFPLFAWLIANGAKHTKNIKLYLVRLFIFGLISQLPFVLANQQLDPNFWRLNIFFTLFLGLLAIFCLEKFTKVWQKSLIVFILVSMGFILNVDYGGFGVLSIILFFIFFQKLELMFISQLIVFGVYYLPPVLFSGSKMLIYAIPAVISSLILILLYKGQEGPKLKYLFYGFYPIHYLIIFIIQKYLLSR